MHPRRRNLGRGRIAPVRDIAQTAVALAVVWHIQEMEAVLLILMVLIRRWTRSRRRSAIRNSVVLASAMALLTGAMDAICGETSVRRWWVKPRAGGAWQNMLRDDDAGADYWYDNVRMGEDTFRGILATVQPFLERTPTHYRNPTPPDQLLAYALYRWATGESFEHSATAFGLGRETGRIAVLDVTRSILQAYPDEVAFPTGQRRVEAFAKFARKGFPSCYGAIDCTHLGIDKPAGVRARAYCNRNRKYSIVAQVVCGADLRIYDVFVGWPGSVHDSRILRNSTLWRRAESGQLFTSDPVELPRHVRTRGYLLGDNGYPSLPWLVVPYGGQHPDESNEKVFDDTQKLQRGCIERAFGRLKNMWRMFLRTHKPHIKSLMLQFRAVCVIHNLLINAGVVMDPRLNRRDDESSDDEDDRPEPPPPNFTVEEARREGHILRHALCAHVAAHTRERLLRAAAHGVGVNPRI
ncbi:hypothetical protein CBR_g8857 [Chara braunii]|uniref:DDE Tnp4 domain-containing protein n=1 Tax=Chara braunii TaxID=69332 RepID=A0A388KN56_CHABU|nr:hypothetical protein CBR_g8857 [Chara braunii]|eukprot:GBG71438.1 hypothetical protein CBR_g8857 [Chara braunii]